MSRLSISDGCMSLPPQARKREMPYGVCCILMGAKVHSNYRGKKGAVAVEAPDGWFVEMAESDYQIAAKIARDIEQTINIGRISSAQQMLALHRIATSKLEAIGDERENLKGIAMLKYRSGSGYWRMVLPAKYMDKTDIYVDIAAGSTRFDYLLEYHTILVQRMHDWESYYMLKKLKDAGKRIIYDIDDDLFDIPDDNPASKIIGRDDMMAAAECMKLADEVTTTTDVLQQRLSGLINGKKPIVIPNALDPDDKWTPTPMTGSPDEWKRIFWQGSASHAEDWMECVEAVDRIMQETKDVRLVLLGFLPPIIAQYHSKPYWKGRVEYLGFNDPETYFELVHHIRADVGIAPLRSLSFNFAKSCCKFVEFSVIGMPTVASGIAPYSPVISDNENGFLAYDTDSWYNAIMLCLRNNKKRLDVVAQARKKVCEDFNIKKTAELWKKVLVP